MGPSPECGNDNQYCDALVCRMLYSRDPVLDIFLAKDLAPELASQVEAAETRRCR